MTVGFGEVKAIADTLPIGFYAKRRIPVTLSPVEQGSYYNSVKDEITISYNMIDEALSHLSDSYDRETAIRTVLYHEVSHAILTPKELEMTDIMNIFEDERIETVLNDFYMDVDFNSFVLAANGYDENSTIPAPETAMQEFYQTVRFRLGENKFLNEVTDIINAHKHLTRNSNYYYDYVYAVETLFNKIAAKYPPDKQGRGNDNGQGNGNSNSNGQSNGQNNNNGNGNGQDSNQNNGQGNSDSASDGGASNTNCNSNGSAASTRSGMASLKNKAKTRNAIIKPDEAKEMIDNLTTSVFNKYYDSKLTDTLSMIIETFNKKNSGGSCLNGYSGVLNPRNLINRKDYRIFDRKSTTKGNNVFGTFHLNLFVDDSGSFNCNRIAVNTLIRSLTEIEKRNPNFKLDIIHCGVGQRIITDVSDRFVTCDQGTRLKAEIFEQFRSLQKSNTYNYNILLYDGDASPEGNSFSAFDTNNTTIISDPENEYYLDRDCHTARVIITRNYCEELYKNVQSALEKAFR